MAGKQSSVKIKLKFSKNVKVVFLVLAAVVLSIVLYKTLVPEPITSWNYYGQILNFRADLRAADKVPVYPNEDAIFLDLVHALAKNVTIVYKYTNDSLAQAYYQVEAIQIVQNIIPAYEHIWKFRPNFDSMEVDSYENLPGKIQNPIIAIVPPPYSNETAIRNYGHVTLLKAKTYEDMDLVTTKLLMLALKIDLDEA